MNRPLLPDVYLPRDTDAYIEGWVSSDRRFLLAQQGIEAQYLNEEGYEVEFLYRGTGFEIKSGDYDSRASLKWYAGKKTRRIRLGSASLCREAGRTELRADILGVLPCRGSAFVRW